jgi:hypothetical protein
MKTCNKCGQTKPVSEYSRKSASKDGYQPSCKVCCAAAHLVWSRQNPDKVREYAQRQKAKDPVKFKKKQNRAMLKHRRGITLEDKTAMLTSQGGGCAICGDPLDAESRYSHVDHSHSTGKIRGILCGECNRGLGAFRDNAESLESAISYLENAQC